MRIAWCTPFSPESAIGRVSRLVCEELSRFEDVQIEVWCPPEAQGMKVSLPVRQLDGSSDVVQRLASADHVVYNMGNYVPFHHAIYRASMAVPGVVVLHDLALHHFFAGVLLDGGHDKYLDAVEQTYGTSARHRAAASLVSQMPALWSWDAITDYPLFEPAIHNAISVVTHSKWAAERVRHSYIGPVTYIPLATPRPGARPRGWGSSSAGEQPPVNMVTVGHVNPNKRVDAVIEAIGSDPALSGAVSYYVCGPVDPVYRQLLTSLIDEYQLHRTVRLCGEVDDEELERILGSADISVNLRHPCVEAGSASLIEALSFGLPVVVSDAGVYRDLPSSCSVKLPPSATSSLIAWELRKLVFDPQRRRSLGAEAQALAMREHQPSTYAERMFRTLRDGLSAAPLLHLAERLAQVVIDLGFGERAPLIGSLAGASETLFSRWVPSGGHSEAVA